MTIKICLIGSIPKGDHKRKSWTDWKIKYKEELSKIEDVEFVDGDSWKEEAEFLKLVGHDSHLIKISDIVIMNAEKKLGVGTAQEMLIAKYFSKPVITILPKDTHHRKSDIVFDGKNIEDWIHPFIRVMSDLVVESVGDAITWIEEYQNNPSIKIKTISIIDESVEAFQKGK